MHRRLSRALGRPTSFGRWWAEGAAHAALDAARRFRPDLLYVSMSPFESAAAAVGVSRAAGLPWVADLRDPWALDEWARYPTGLHRAVETRRMGHRLQSASAVVANTPEAARVLRARFPVLASRVSVVPNGWDADDFMPPVPIRSDGRFRIVLTGYSHGPPEGTALSRALGGVVRGLDVSTRSHRPLLEALALLDRERPDLSTRVEVHVAGAAKRAADGTADGRLVEHGYLRHDQAIALMRSADLLFLPMHDLPVGTRATTVPGKTYEYLATGRPILAAVPDGDARDMLAGLPGVWTCRPSDVKLMADALVAAIESSPAPTLDRTEVVAGFERRVQTRRLARVFDDVIASR
jgi:glycosyltransferase involved in cell wall biosynthesis